MSWKYGRWLLGRNTSVTSHFSPCMQGMVVRDSESGTGAKDPGCCDMGATEQRSMYFSSAEMGKYQQPCEGKRQSPHEGT
eukprot:1161540-Pelagomonas_calceolata.AAC.8